MKQVSLQRLLSMTLLVTALLAAGAPQAAGAPAVPVKPDVSAKLAGKTVFLDPGHQGGAEGHNLAKQVANGRGGTKDCQTSGTTTRAGMPEHTVTWRVTQLVKASMESLGAKVVLSRPNDTGWGGCVTDRAQAANASGASVAMSIHADGAPEAHRGFHLIVPQLPVPNADVQRVQSTEGLAATRAVRDAYLKAGFVPASYVGAVEGIQTRADIAGPALTTVPNIFLEMGNGKNPVDAELLETPQGQIKHAVAITTGLVAYLLGVGPSLAARPATAPGSPVIAPAIAPRTQPDVPAAPSAGPESGTTPGAGTSPYAAPQTGASPSGASPSGTVPSGTAPSGTSPYGSGQSGASPYGSGQSGASPYGSGRTGTSPYGGTDPYANNQPGKEVPSGLGATVTQLLQPLLQTLGIDMPGGTSGLVDAMSELATKLISAALTK